MTSPAGFSVGGLTAMPGSQVRGFCEVSLGTDTTSLPVAVTHGSAPGPVLAVTAGIHGGEYVPMVAVRQFVAGLDPAHLSGTIIACLQASPVAFRQRTAFVNPVDGENLNRSFPGDRSGSPTQRLAAWLWQNVLSRADYYVDCHCGDLPEVLDSFAGVAPGSDGSLSAQARALARCFDVSRIILERTRGSAVYEAAMAGTSAVLVEIGGYGQWSQEQADVQRLGLRRVAALAGILPAAGDQGARLDLPVFEDAADVRCERTGLWFPDVAPGDEVAAGERLGRLEDPFGEDVRDVRAPAAGVLAYGLGSLAAAEGDLLASIVRRVGGA